MENLTSQLTRTCNACGIEKPLSAFLQLSGAHGTSYGKICAQCRSIGKVEKPISTVTDEERSTEPSGAGIRGKEKLYVDVKREQKIHTLKELYRKEDVKKQETMEKKNNQVSLKEASEKKHRESYLDSQKQAILASKKAQPSQQTVPQQQAQKLTNIRAVTEHHRVALENKKHQQVETIKSIEKEEARKTTTDFNNLFHAIEPGKIEMQGELRRFFTWLGNSAPIVQTLMKGKGFAAAHNKPPRPLAAENKSTPLLPPRRGRS